MMFYINLAKCGVKRITFSRSQYVCQQHIRLSAKDDNDAYHNREVALGML